MSCYSGIKLLYFVPKSASECFDRVNKNQTHPPLGVGNVHVQHETFG